VQSVVTHATIPILFSSGYSHARDSLTDEEGKGERKRGKNGTGRSWQTRTGT